MKRFGGSATGSVRSLAPFEGYGCVKAESKCVENRVSIIVSPTII